MKRFTILCICLIPLLLFSSKTSSFKFDSKADITVGGKVWADIFENCINDISNAFLFSEVSVSIYNDKVQLIANTKTDANGAYSFSVPEGRYLIVLDKENFQASNILANLQPCGIAADPNNDVPNDNNGYWHPGEYIQTDTIELIDGQEPGGNTNFTIDFGLTFDCSAENNVFSYNYCYEAAVNPVCNLVDFQQGCSTNYGFPNSGGPNPFCTDGSLNPFSISWFSFIAGYGDYDIEIEILGCYPDSMRNKGGMIAALFESDLSGNNCWVENSLFCSETPTNDKITIPASTLMTPGGQYILAIDGFKGSVCGYDIIIGTGFIPFIIPDPTKIECVNAINCDTFELNKPIQFLINDLDNSYDSIENITTFWYIQDLNGNIIEHWSTNPDMISMTNTISFQLDIEGTYIICCEEISDICKNVIAPDLCYQFKIVNGNIIMSSEYSQSLNIKIFPNPTTNLLKIEGDEDFLKASFTNLLGQKIELEVKNSLIDMSILSSGIYLMKLDKNGEEFVKKVVKL